MKHILFETHLGDRFLAWLERSFGLVVITADTMKGAIVLRATETLRDRMVECARDWREKANCIDWNNPGEKVAGWVYLSCANDVDDATRLSSR